MDEIKDIAKKDQSQFLDEVIIRTHPFGHNISGARAYARAERLIAAIHLVTNHIPRDEPGRALARRAGIHLLSAILLLRDEMRVSGSPALGRVQALIRKLISLIRVLSVAGYISAQNLEALVGAFDELGVFLVSSQKTPLSERVVLSKDELLTSGSTLVHMRPTVSPRKPTSVKDRIKDIDKMSDRTDKTYSRIEGILAILGSQGQLGIKDIAANLPEYSEKMIQRELKVLVARGRVKKTGSKRWSMYALA